MYSIDVVFRKWKDGTIDAIMPYEVDTNYTVTCYSRIGQHSMADYDHVMRQTVPARPEEYAALLKELQGLDYEVRVIKRANRDVMSRLWQDLPMLH